MAAKKGLWFLLVGLAVVMLAGPLAAPGGGEAPLPLVPLPVMVERSPGSYLLKAKSPLLVPGEESHVRSAAVFADKVRARFGVELTLITYSGEKILCEPGEVPSLRGCVPCRGAIVAGRAVEWCGGVPVPGEAQGDEGYKLAVSPDMVLIETGTAHGMHNALMTILQLLDHRPGQAEIPSVRVLDYPRFGWRGMLLDPARSFIPPDIIKKYIDLLSELKMTVLHWHLVDDQGWRIEMTSRPRLHEVGGILHNQSEKKLRALDRHGWGRDGRGYYTQAELKEIIAYARDRHVMIVPEIDVPGHTTAMISAYPDLSCSGRQIEVGKVGRLYRNALCPGKEEVYEFLDIIFGEVAAIFPSPYIHIGGDEVWTREWMSAPENQWLIEKYGYTDNDGLQSYFTRRVNDILKKHNRIMVAWDEITSYLPEGAVIQAWRKHDYATQAARAGHDAVVSPTSHCYIDYPQLTFTLKNLYHFEPIPEGLETELKHHILGGEVNLWGERVTMDNIDRKAFPRVIAHAEVMWSPKKARDWEDFVSRLKPLKKTMEGRGVGFGTTWRALMFML